MPRGFTLLECLVVVFIFAALLTASSAGFRQAYDHIKMKKTAVDLYGFFTQSRSEAVLRREELHIHIVESQSSKDLWKLELHSDETHGFQEPILYLTGSGIRLQVSESQDAIDRRKVIRFNQLSGYPMGSGNLLFSASGKDGERLKLVYFGAVGRFRICGDGQEAYGYQPC